MSKSLRDQLLNAGLVTKQKAKDASKSQYKKNKQTQKVQSAKKSKGAEPKPYDLQESASDRAQRIRDEKKARDRALEEKRKANAAVRETVAQVKQLVQVYKVERSQGDEVFRFTIAALGKSIKKIHVNTDQHRALTVGQLGIVHFQDQFILIKPEGVQKIRERTPDAVYWAVFMRF